MERCHSGGGLVMFKEKTMKKLALYFSTVVAALLFAACDKEIILSDDNRGGDSSDSVVVNISVDGMFGNDTKAVKAGWENGDKLNIWFDGAYWNVAPQLVLTYNGSSWDASSVSSSILSASGKFIVIYEASNSLFNATISNTYARFPGNSTDGYNVPVSCYKNGVSYTFSDGTLTANISGWKFFSQLQVVITGLSKSADMYAMTIDGVENRSAFLFSNNAAYASNHSTGGWSAGVANSDGVAFCYGLNSNTNARDITFTLKDKETGTIYTYTKNSTALNLNENNLKAIRIASSKFSAVPSYVDLGLSVKWATYNVGATAPEGYGDYLSWAATEPFYEDGYAQEDPQAHWKTGKSYGYTLAYKSDALTYIPYLTYYGYGLNGSTKWTKYVASTYSNHKDAGATDANAIKIILDPEDDVAHAQWGENWRMPTYEEWNELISNCTWTWTTLDGINGYKVQSTKTGYTDKWIFLPAAGYRYGTSLNKSGENGCYWSSKLKIPTISAPVSDNPDYALFLEFTSSQKKTNVDYRSYGYSVRPVYSDVENCGITGVSLNTTATSIARINGYAWLSATVTKKSGAVNTQVEWSSSNPDIATVNAVGYVTNKSGGVATITARTVFGGFTASCVVNTYQYVDLGLSSGTMWATFNIGATKPEEYGSYFAWGETTPKSAYSWSTYAHGNASNNLTKYCSGDSKTVLDLEDDAARANWGGSWRLPTMAEWYELMNSDNCSWESAEMNGVDGFKVMSKSNDRWIFLPLAGYYDGENRSLAGSEGHYWSSSLNECETAAELLMQSTYPEDANNNRNRGLPIRPVWNKNE